MIRSSRPFLALLTVLVLSVPLSAQDKAKKKNRAGEPAKPDPDQTVVYKTLDEVELSLHVFLPTMDADTPRPAIVFFFGGGWKGGNPNQFYPQSRRLADLGMVAFCAEYRVESRNKTTPKECVSDGKSAMRWVRKHASRFKIDPNRIAAGGGSAGGHVATATATVEAFDDPSDDLSISCRPNALALFNPVYDNGPDGYGHSRVKEYWREISPLHLLHESMPPTIVYLGTKDKLIPVDTAKSFQAKMKDLGIRSDLHLYQEMGHGFFNRGDEFKDTLNKTVEFFRSLGYIE